MPTFYFEYAFCLLENAGTVSRDILTSGVWIVVLNIATFVSTLLFGDDCFVRSGPLNNQEILLYPAIPPDPSGKNKIDLLPNKGGFHDKL